MLYGLNTSKWNQWNLQCHIYHDSYPSDISFFLHRFLVSWSYVQTDFWPFTFTPDTRTCDIQAYCCCCDLDLGDKCTYFTDQVIHPKKCHVCSLGWKTENYAKYPKISLIQLPSCLISIDSLNLTPHTAYKTFTGMKDNFVLFPHFTRSDVIKQYSGPTIDTHTNTLHRWKSKWLWATKLGKNYVVSKIYIRFLIKFLLIFFFKLS